MRSGFAFTFGITIVGLINNLDALSKNAYRSTHAHFAEMTGDGINPTEMVASLISLEQSFADAAHSRDSPGRSSNR